METENLDIIEVEAEIIDSPEPETEEIWYSALQVQDLAGIKKQHLQQAVVKLQNIYHIDLSALRRGAGRATEYSELALGAIKLLNAGKLSELRRLVDKVPAALPTVESSAIVFLDRHNQIAVTSASAADINLTQIASFKSGLLNNYRELGRALGKQAAAEVRLGFTEEVKAALSDLQES